MSRVACLATRVDALGGRVAGSRLVLSLLETEEFFMRKVPALVALVALVAAACGVSAPPPTTMVVPGDAGAAFPVEVAGVRIEQRLTRIVSASASHTEMLYAIGAGDQVAATDVFSDYPPAAAETEKIDAFNLSVEAVAALRPDLVIISFDPGDVVSGLAAVGIPALVFDAPASLEEAYAQMNFVGQATGHGAEAATLVAMVSGEIDAILAQVPRLDTPLTYYYELDPSYFSLTSSTFIGTVFAAMGMVSIADPADASGFGYPQLSAEFILEQDPDFVVLADIKCCSMSLLAIAERPGWSLLTAVQSGSVIELDDDIASRWGPRLVELAQAFSDAVAAFDSGAKATEPADG